MAASRPGERYGGGGARGNVEVLGNKGPWGSEGRGPPPLGPSRGVRVSGFEHRSLSGNIRSKF